ncbi:MAG: hypothetical protein JST54_11750 [Deltaproteobacteria bacterium]|nr:hypothetical protein [Deltaproteobacteria bacterium]
MLLLFLFGLLILVAWFVAIVVFKVAAVGIHLLLLVAVALFAIGFIRRGGEGSRRRSV